VIIKDNKMRREFWQKRFSSIIGDDAISNIIEASIYKLYIFKQDENEYEQKAKQLALNLDSTSYIKNTNLRKKIISGEIDPHQLVFLTPQELFPEKWEQTILANKEILKKQVEGSKARPTTDAFTCPKCKKKETTYYEQQTRGADEPMTKFITCVVDGCGKQWKI
jgi:transcription elongation factor S-II